MSNIFLRVVVRTNVVSDAVADPTLGVGFVLSESEVAAAVCYVFHQNIICYFPINITHTNLPC